MKSKGKKQKATGWREKQRQAKFSASIKFASMSNNEIADALRQNCTSFLQSHAWKSMRLKVLAHYGDKCMCCGCIPRDKRQVNVDHIKPRKTFPDLSLVFDNLQVLCASCNKAKGNNHMTDYRKKLAP